MQRNDVQDDEKQQLQENEDSFNQVLHKEFRDYNSSFSSSSSTFHEWMGILFGFMTTGNEKSQGNTRNVWSSSEYVVCEADASTDTTKDGCVWFVFLWRHELLNNRLS